MTGLAWVVGRGGLLGSALERALRARAAVWAPESPFPWNQPARLERALASAVDSFRRAVERGGPEPWTLAWCAGAGGVGTSAPDLDRECAAWDFFLGRLSEALRGRPGTVFLSSSAGGLYAGSAEHPVDEASPVRPLSGYGRAKQRQEEALAAWTQGRREVATLVGRLSNLYGPGQRLDKPQGLISHVSRCLLLDRPAHVFVPLDTIRDWLFVEDAAQRVAAALERLGGEAEAGGPATRVTKIFASEQETSIAALVGVFRRVARRPLRIVCGLHPAAAEQPARLSFRSRVWAEDPPAPVTSLLEGVDRVFRHHLALHQAGRLAAPEPSL